MFRNLITALTIIIPIFASGCLAQHVYNVGVNREKMGFQSVSVASDGDVLLSGYVLKNNVYYDLHAYLDAHFLYTRLRNEVLVEQRVVHIRAPDLRSLDTHAWPIVRMDLRNNDSVQRGVPTKFMSSTQVYPAAVTVPYTYENKTFFLQFDKPAAQWSDRAPWSYPCQILLIPAAALDVAFEAAWAPIWFIFFSHTH
jgi:hypothetical protein